MKKNYLFCGVLIDGTKFRSEFKLTLKVCTLTAGLNRECDLGFPCE